MTATRSGPERLAAGSAGGHEIPASGDRTDTSLRSRPVGKASKADREPTAHDRKALNQLLLVLAVVVTSIALSLATGKGIFIVGYIVAIAYAVHGPRHDNRPWSELGLKRGFMTDLRLVWYLVAIEAVLFQLAPPSFALANALGYYHQLLDHISGRAPIHLDTGTGIAALVGLLLVAAVLTFLEDLVFRVTIQERLSWFIGTPAAILIASILFASAHAIAAPASAPILLLDVAGVFIDSILLGAIYAKTHNLILTWTTHYAGDVVALIALLTIF